MLFNTVKKHDTRVEWARRGASSRTWNPSRSGVRSLAHCIKLNMQTWFSSPSEEETKLIKFANVNNFLNEISTFLLSGCLQDLQLPVSWTTLKLVRSWLQICQLTGHIEQDTTHMAGAGAPPAFRPA